MSLTVGDAPAYPCKTTAADEMDFRLKVVLTAAGAVDTTNTKTSDTQFACVKNGGTTGQYDLTFPITPGEAFFTFEVYSPAATIADAYIKALTETSGTASIVCVAPNGTAAYGASGDRIYIRLVADRRNLG